jgi:hypothetical protein
MDSSSCYICSRKTSEKIERKKGCRRCNKEVCKLCYDFNLFLCKNCHTKYECIDSYLFAYRAIKRQQPFEFLLVNRKI